MKQKKDDIKIPPFTLANFPIKSGKSMENHLLSINTNKATSKNDIPSKIFKKFAKPLSAPMA